MESKKHDETCVDSTYFKQTIGSLRYMLHAQDLISPIELY